MRALTIFSLAVLSLAAALLAAPGCGRQSTRSPGSPSGAPALISITPSQAAVGDAITLRGSGFAATDNAIKIGEGYLHGVAAAGMASLTFTLPPALTPCPPGTQACIALALLVTPGEYQVSVVTPKGASNALTLRVVGK